MQKKISGSGPGRSEKKTASVKESGLSAPVTIHVHSKEGQSAREIAVEVMNILKRESKRRLYD